MSKKQINNRLNELFDNIKEEEKALEKPATKSSKKRKKKSQQEPRSASFDAKTEALSVSVGASDSYSTMSLPIGIDTEFWGTLQVVDNTPNRQWNREEQLLVQQVTDQLVLALQNANLYQETERQREELELVNRIVTDVSSSLELEKDLEIITKEVAQISNALHVGIALLNDEKTHLVLTADYPKTPDDLGLKIPLEGNISSQKVLDTLQPLTIQDVQNNPLTEGIKEIMKIRGTESLVIFPLISGNEAIGTLGVDFGDPFAELSQNQIDLIQTILLQASTSIETSRFFQEVQLSEERARIIVENAPEAIVMIDIETGLFIEPNDNALLLYGLDKEEILKVGPADVSPIEQPDGRLSTEAAMEKIQQALDGENPVFDWTYLHSSGDEILCEVRLVQLPGATRTLIRASVIDITERKLAEQTLRRQNDYMAAAAEVGRLVTSTLDLEILFRRAVNLLQEHFGYYHAAIFIIEETGFDAIVREATGEAGQEMKKREHSLTIGSKSVVGTATGTGKPYVVNNVEEAALHHVNPLLPNTKSEAAIPLKIGRRIVGAIDLQATEVDAFTKEDIAVLQLLGDQFATAIDNARSYKLAQDAFIEMRELEKLKSQFLANMSHELRTPLNSIIGFSRVILKGIDGPVTDLQQQDLTAIYNSGQHLLGLINDILDLSKIEAGKMELTFDEVDIEKLIKSVMSTVLGLIKDKPVQLVDELEENLPTVKADSMRIRQILINLFSNAAKFTDEGTITVTARREEAGVRISVIDSGPGISPEDQEKLFQAFSQVDASATRATGGSGLGLSISKQLVTMHGGEIGLNSEVGKGSEFFFTLLAYEEQEEATEDASEENLIANDSPVILAIDDDEKVIDLYKRYLDEQGYQVVALTDPKKAVERAKELQPHAITLDIMMPGYDGWQVLEDLKSDPETQIYPTIICSIISDTEKGYALGATDYLLKPILDNDLLSALGRLKDSGEIYNILIIDDDADDLRLLEKLLTENEDYKVTLADNGPEGWEMIINDPPQAVILDLFMPEMDGFQIMESMQASDELKEIPVIVISGGDLSTTQQEKLDSLNLHLLQKGTLESEDLLTTLERSLNHLKKSN